MASVTSRVLLFILIVHALSHAVFVKGGRKDKEFVKHKRAVKTIKGEDGDVIDCVEIYKQPAFDHPLLKNHKIQMKPSSYPDGMRRNINDSQVELIQTWHKRGRCQEGTIPVRRTPSSNLHSKFAGKLGDSTKFVNEKTDSLNKSSLVIEHASVLTPFGKYYGARADINVWNPEVEVNSEQSLSRITVLSDSPDDVNTIEAGWIVSPGVYGDGKTRFYLAWNIYNNSNQTGCIDLRCPGFVHLNKDWAMGTVLQPVSKYNTLEQFEIFVSIFQDKPTGNWWVQVVDKLLGYWPRSIFTGLADSASWVTWGGRITNVASQGHHTSTDMGSGHPVAEAYGGASYFKKVQVMDTYQNWAPPTKLGPIVTKPSCYDVRIGTEKDPNFGTYFFYGGTGFSPFCQ